MADDLAPRSFYCPHCGSENPPYDFIPNSSKNLTMEATWVTIVCRGKFSLGTCDRILSVGLVQFQTFVAMVPR